MSDTPRTDNAVPYMDNPYAQSATVQASFARKLERELAAVTAERDALREDKERLGSGCIEIYRQACDRLNHAEELLNELSSGFWVDVMDRHVEGMGQKVLEYWKKQGGRDE